MNGFFGTTTADVVATWVAALVTLVVLGALLGERRLFGWSQHLFAGLVTGFLALLVITEVIGPRLVAPLASGQTGSGELWLGLGVVGLAAATPWLPRAVAAIPVSIALGALAAFALGGAVVGTILPQVAAAGTAGGDTAADTAVALTGAGITALVLTAFLHGLPRRRALAVASSTGRWLLVVGIGAWLGYLLLARLLLLLDRIAFLLGDWIGVGP